jgi:TDG/mug DNA glycosylase family protein
MRGPELDRIRHGLHLLFIGYNPSLYSAQVMHHYAGKNNRFYRILYEAGMTDRLFSPFEDMDLLDQGIGFTNIVHRPTKTAAEITPGEYRAGRVQLLNKLQTYQPKLACFVGKGVYLAYSGKKKAEWGLQPDSVAGGVLEFAAPSSSGLVRMKISEIVDIYKEIPIIMKKKQAISEM